MQSFPAGPNYADYMVFGAQFEDAFELYRKRHDKEWCHTDCASFRVMEEEGIVRRFRTIATLSRRGSLALMRS